MERPLLHSVTVASRLVRATAASLASAIASSSALLARRRGSRSASSSTSHTRASRNAVTASSSRGQEVRSQIRQLEAVEVVRARLAVRPRRDPQVARVVHGAIGQPRFDPARELVVAGEERHRPRGLREEPPARRVEPGGLAAEEGRGRRQRQEHRRLAAQHAVSAKQRVGILDADVDVMARRHHVGPVGVADEDVVGVLRVGEMELAGVAERDGRARG